MDWGMLEKIHLLK